MALKIIILAAGQSKRMKTSISKVLHPLAGVPLLQRVVNTAEKLIPQEIFVVYNSAQVLEKMPHLPVQWLEQKKQEGTGHAVMPALAFLKDDDQVLILYGDVPLITAPTLTKLLSETPKNGLGILVVERDDPYGYGRIIRDRNKKIITIVEQRDATARQDKIKEVNTGIMTTTGKNLKKWLPKLKNHNAQKEYYLTNIVPLAVKDKCKVVGVAADYILETQGINDRIELATLERHYQMLQAEYLMQNGVTIMDPERLDIRGDVAIEQDVTLDINVILEGAVEINSNTTIGANCVLRNVKIGRDVTIFPNCVIEDAVINNGCKIGPFARIRPETVLNENVHIGNFVELKKTTMDDNSKAGHLAYLGDAVIGKNVNVGAGVITCNYDGVNKFQTTIEEGAFIGSDSQLVAPVTIGAHAFIGAGSTICKDAPAGKLTLSRVKQTTIENWQPPTKRNKAKE